MGQLWVRTNFDAGPNLGLANFVWAKYGTGQLWVWTSFEAEPTLGLANFVWANCGTGQLSLGQLWLDIMLISSYFGIFTCTKVGPG